MNVGDIVLVNATEEWFDKQGVDPDIFQGKEVEIVRGDEDGSQIPLFVRLLDGSDDFYCSYDQLEPLSPDLEPGVEVGYRYNCNVYPTAERANEAAQCDAIRKTGLNPVTLMTHKALVLRYLS